MNLASAISEIRGHAIETLSELIRIKSDAEDPVTTENGETYPFGPGVQDAFAYLLNKAEEDGFETLNVDNYGGHIEWGEGEEVLGILGHLDVVPAEGEWEEEPYGGKVDDKYIWGRGTLDDKGPLLAAYFAMKVLKAEGFVPDRRVRLILGLDEETNWAGMEYYFNHVKKPTFGFTPDGDFPVIMGEKGVLEFELAKKIGKDPQDGLNLTRLSGGTVTNMVPAAARAVVKSKDREVYEKVKELAQVFRDDGFTVRTKGVGTALEITTEGKAAHGAHPEDGVNAISILMDFLSRLNLANEDVSEFIEFYNKHIGFGINGEKINCGFEDEESGKLSMNNGIVYFDGEEISCNMNVRFPVTKRGDDIYDAMMPVLDTYNVGVVKIREEKPLYFPADSPLISTLMDVYRGATGDTENGPLVIGGGTYAKSTDNCVAFGGLFPGDEDIMHQKNERIEIEKYIKQIEIYAEAIRRLASSEFSLS